MSILNIKMHKYSREMTKSRRYRDFQKTLNVKTTGGPPTKLSLDVDPEVKHSFKAEISLVRVPQTTLPEYYQALLFFFSSHCRRT